MLKENVVNAGKYFQRKKNNDTYNRHIVFDNFKQCGNKMGKQYEAHSLKTTITLRLIKHYYALKVCVNIFSQTFK